MTSLSLFLFVLQYILQIVRKHSTARFPQLHVASRQALAADLKQQLIKQS
jgi:hypothetical protein